MARRAVLGVNLMGHSGTDGSTDDVNVNVVFGVVFWGFEASTPPVLTHRFLVGCFSTPIMKDESYKQEGCEAVSTSYYVDRSFELCWLHKFLKCSCRPSS